MRRGKTHSRVLFLVVFTVIMVEKFNVRVPPVVYATSKSEHSIYMRKKSMSKLEYRDNMKNAKSVLPAQTKQQIWLGAEQTD